jgi:hypothetical protein
MEEMFTLLAVAKEGDLMEDCSCPLCGQGVHILWNNPHRRPKWGKLDVACPECDGAFTITPQIAVRYVARA